MFGFRIERRGPRLTLTLPAGRARTGRWGKAEGEGRDAFVFDPNEMVAWGPFASDTEAEAFIASDKYLASWCVLTSRSAMSRHLVPTYPPAAYHGAWPKED